MNTNQSATLYCSFCGDRNISWARIGEAMGITRQSAWERFKTLD